MTPTPMAVADAVQVLTDLNIVGVIVLAATIGIAVMLYKRFRR